MPLPSWPSTGRLRNSTDHPKALCLSTAGTLLTTHTHSLSLSLSISLCVCVCVCCSAGVGRTGTLITVDRVLDQIAKEGLVDIAGVIQQLRNQRMKMVQNPVSV